ncbi:MAG: GAF domain-containing protein [Spirochaetota bacterium]
MTMSPTTPGISDDSGLLEAVLRANQELPGSGGDPQTVAGVIELVGRAARVDRVYIFQFRSDESSTIVANQRFEWSAADVTPQIDNPDLQDVPMREAGYGRWLDRFAAYLPVAGRIAAFPDGERHMLEKQGIRSLVVLPIYADALLWGFVGFDDCTTDRLWTDAELNLLLSLAISLGAALVSAPEQAADTSDRARTNSRISGYAAIAGGLVLSDAESDDAASSAAFSRRAVEARIRALVRTHQYLKTRAGDDHEPLVDYLVALQDHFHLITRDDGVRTAVLAPRAHDVHVRSETLPAIGLLVTERLATVHEADASAGTLDHLVVTVLVDGSRATISIAGFDENGHHVDLTVSTTASGMLFERRLQSYLGGQVTGPRTGASSSVATFPVVR